MFATYELQRSSLELFDGYIAKWIGEIDYSK